MSKVQTGGIQVHSAGNFQHPNANVYDVEYKPKEKIEEKTTIDPFTGW